jgi:hypothetical protein
VRGAAGRGCAFAPARSPRAHRRPPAAAGIALHRVAGNIHLAGSARNGGGGMQMQAMFGFALPPDYGDFNASHRIVSLAFGPPFPGQLRPLDGLVQPAAVQGTQFQYHIKVVPTSYEYLSGYVVDSQQISVTDFVHAPQPGAGFLVQPGMWLRFDFSPIMVRQVETRTNFLFFLTSVFSIVGGVWALSGLLHAIFHRVAETAKTK